MLSIEAYGALFDALDKRGVSLLTSPQNYACCHHAPRSYDQLTEWMPQTAWLTIGELDNSARRRVVLAQFGSTALIIKDWVKSQASGYWREACYISDASDTNEVDRVVD